MSTYDSPPPETPWPEKLPKAVRNWAMLCHLAAIAGYVLPLIGNILGPLVVWLLKKEDHEFINDQGKEAVNFQITVTIGLLLCFPLILLFGLGIVLMIVIVIVAVILMIVAIMQSSEGVRYRYPWALRLIE